MSSVQQLTEEFFENLQELSLIKLGISQYIEQANTNWQNFFLEFLQEKLESLDLAILENPQLRPNWISQKKVSRTLVTILGELHFTRRYYKNRKSQDFSFLLDALVGVEAGERIDKAAKAAICNHAWEDSYRKSSELAVDGLVSKTSVMRILREVELAELPAKKQDEPLHEIHLQVDEDHVAMQDGSNQELRLAVIHESSVKKGKKGELVNRHVNIDHSEGVEGFWDRVWNEMCRNYNLAEDCQIYIHGDGAAWIRHGVEMFDQSHFVLDKFHALKYLRKIAPKDTGEYRELQKLMYEAKRSEFMTMAKSCFGKWDLNPETQEAALKYFRNNWHGIQIWHDRPHVAGSCAEGLVSHCLSRRFSTFPMGWRTKGLDAVAKLREYVLNGGKVSYRDFKRRQSENKKLKVYDSVNIKGLKEKVASGRSLAPLPTQVFTMAKRGALSELFESIKNGGNIFDL